MKLTNATRQAFVLAVMQDVPRTDFEEAVRKRAVDLAYGVLPKSAQQLWDNPEHRDLLSSWVVRFDGVSVELPPLPAGADPGFSNAWYVPMSGVQDEKLRQLLAENAEQDNRLAELRGRLKAVVDGCSTTKQLRDALPEFAKYLPDEQVKTRNLPAIANVVSDFMKAGWSEGKKPTAEEVTT